MSSQLARVCSVVPGLLRGVGACAAVSAQQNFSMYCATPTSSPIQSSSFIMGRFVSSSTTGQQASQAAPVEAKSEGDIAPAAQQDTKYPSPFEFPGPRTFGIGLFSIAALLSSEWIYLTHEFIEVMAFWLVFTFLYQNLAPVFGQMLDQQAADIKTQELAKITAAKNALNIEELSKRYEPTLVSAKQLLSSDIQHLKTLEPRIEQYAKSVRVKAMLDLHVENKLSGEQQMNSYMAKRFRRAVMRMVASQRSN